MSTAVVVALLSAAGAGGCFWASQRERGRLTHLLATRPTTLVELQALQADVAREIGGGSFRERVKLQGALLCPSPLQAPFSGEPCMAYSSRIVELYDELVESTDQQGRTTRSWRQGEQELSCESRRSRFQLGQGNLSASVDPDGAELDMQSVFNRTEPADWSGAAAFGNLGSGGVAATLLAGAALVGTAMSTGTSLANLAPGTRRRLGFRREESIFPAHGEVFLVAEASDAGGVITLQKPAGEGLFMIRRGGEEQLQQQLRRAARVWNWVAIALAVLAVGAILMALVG